MIVQFRIDDSDWHDGELLREFNDGSALIQNLDELNSRGKPFKPIKIKKHDWFIENKEVMKNE